MNNQEGSDAEDEFFGDQSDDEDHDLYSQLHVNEVMQDARRAHGAMDKHEINSQRETHRNIGYHEAYDDYKEERLQEGFEAGYRQYINDAKKLGMLLGECVGNVSSTVREGTKKINSGNESTDDDGMRTDLIGEVRQYLERAQSTTENNIIVPLVNDNEDVRKIIDYLEMTVKENS